MGIGAGIEVERDGYGEWSGVRWNDNGEGVGWTDDAVDVSHYLMGECSL